MKKIIAIALIAILSLCTQAYAGRFLCLHYKNDSLTPTTCQFLHDKFGFDSKPYSQYTEKKYDIIWLAGFGTPDGFWSDSEGNNRVSWGALATKYKVKILIVDACYSGKIFDYPIPKGVIIISSTNACSVSVNTPEKWSNGEYIASLASMFYCLYIGSQKYIGCSGNKADPQVCQMSIIMHSCANWNYRNILLRDIQEYPQYHPDLSIGTVLLNGKPWRSLK